MTEPQLVPLWSDERIEDYANANFDVSEYFEVVQGMKAVRDEYEARIADLQRLVEQLEANQRKPASNQYAGVRGGLIKGRIRTKGTPRVPGGPSELRPGFYDAVRQATVDDLMWALNLLIKHPQARRTHRTERIQQIDKRLREISQQEEADK